MRYDFLIQPKEPGQPYDPAPIEKALAEKLVIHTDGTKLWRLKSGDLEIRPLSEGGVVIATELRAPLSDKLELIREAVLETVALAAAAGEYRVVDPQLNKSLTVADEGNVVSQFQRTAEYAGQYAGVSSAVVASFGAAEPEGMRPGTKVLLGLAVFFIALYLAVDALNG